MKQLLIHVPSMMSPPDAIYWEEPDGDLGEYAPEDTASVRHARMVLYTKQKDDPWNPWWHQLSEMVPHLDWWNVYEVADDTDPAEFLNYLVTPVDEYTGSYRPHADST